MAARKQSYLCLACGEAQAKWSGSCSYCGAWNQLQEVARPANNSKTVSDSCDIGLLSAVDTDAAPRIQSGTKTLDRVLGGGITQGSVVLIGGDPGIGKSTLLLQVASALGRSGAKTIYLSGEESSTQVAARAARLGLALGKIWLLTETKLEAIMATITCEQPAVLIVDSVQTIYSELLGASAGSISQVRECASQLVRIAKKLNIVVFMVSHVTKEGGIAGPKVLEHMVDTVLYFEGDSGSRFRLVRASKNRYGTVNEIGIFSMTEKGLREVSQPSAIFLSRTEEVPGSVVTVTWSGTQPLLLEVQALADHSYNTPGRRLTIGFDANRLSMLLSVLHRHGGVEAHTADIFVNVVGGIRLTETAADLPVLLAVVSSLKKKSCSQGLAIFGEVGLVGEIRPVPNGPERISEAQKHGFTTIIVPTANAPKRSSAEIEIVRVKTLADVLHYLSREG